jgi:hypothetical protein
MFKRTSIYALAAVAALGVTALATSSASARAGGGAGGPVGMHGPMGVSVKPHGPMGLSIKPNKPVVTGIIIKPKPPIVTGIIIHKPGPHHHWCKWHSCGPNWVIGGGVGVVATGVVASTPVAAAAPAPCTCLTKTYLQDGSVLFKDVCTTESAIAPADQKAAN